MAIFGGTAQLNIKDYKSHVIGIISVVVVPPIHSQFHKFKKVMPAAFKFNVIVN